MIESFSLFLADVDVTHKIADEISESVVLSQNGGSLEIFVEFFSFT